MERVYDAGRAWWELVTGRGARGVEIEIEEVEIDEGDLYDYPEGLPVCVPGLEPLVRRVTAVSGRHDAIRVGDYVQIADNGAVTIYRE